MIRPAPRARRPGTDVAHQSFCFHDADVGFLADGQQIIDDIAGDLSAITPMVRQADLMHGAAINFQGTHARGDQDAGLDGGTRGHDAGPPAVLKMNFRSQFGRNFSE